MKALRCIALLVFGAKLWAGALPVTVDATTKALVYPTAAQLRAANDLLAATAAATLYQPLSANLTALSGQASTGYGRGLLNLSDATALRSYAGAVIGTNVQAWSANLDAWSALAPSTKADTTALAAHLADLANPHQTTKAQVGLPWADNTADVDKPISTATQAALDAKVPLTRTINGHALTADVTVTKSDVALGNVTNDAQVKRTEMGAASGVATLDSAGKLLTTQVPDLSIVTYLGSVASQAAMLALTGQSGDWCNRTDTGTVYVIIGTDPSQLSSWMQLNYPTAPVTSVAGRTGAITLNSADVGLGAVPNVNATNADNITSGTLPNARLVGIPNTSLANFSVTISGHPLALGGSLALAQADITGLHTTDAVTFGSLALNGSATATGGWFITNRAANTNYGIVQYQTAGVSKWYAGLLNDGSETYHLFDVVNNNDRYVFAPGGLTLSAGTPLTVGGLTTTAGLISSATITAQSGLNITSAAALDVTGPDNTGALGTSNVKVYSANRLAHIDLNFAGLNSSNSTFALGIAGASAQSWTATGSTIAGNLAVSGTGLNNFSGSIQANTSDNVSPSIIVRAGDQVPILRFTSSSSASANIREWEITTNGNAYGDWELRVGASRGSDPLAGTLALKVDRSANATLAGNLTASGTGPHYFGGLIRGTSATPAFPAAGKGFELFYDGVNDRTALQSYDRTGAAWKPVFFSASAFEFAAGSVTIDANLTVSGGSGVAVVPSGTSWAITAMTAPAAAASAINQFIPAGTISASNPIWNVGQRGSSQGPLSIWRYDGTHEANDVTISAAGAVTFGGNVVVSGATSLTAPVTITKLAGNAVTVDGNFNNVVLRSPASTNMGYAVALADNASVGGYTFATAAGARAGAMLYQGGVGLIFQTGNGAGTNALILSDSQAATFSGDVSLSSGKTLQLGNAYVAGTPTANATVTVKDSNGVTVQLLAIHP
jgi:hypothetical protein